MSAMHVRVRCGGEHYALPVANVREIAQPGQITPVPGAPSPVLGVWNLRGDVMAVLDLAALLGIEADEEPDRIVVAEDGGLHAGIAVESVLDVGSLPELREPTDSEYLSAAVLLERTPVGIVDVTAVLSMVGAGAREVLL
jgi:purine-binding chemotaxis protein CheW